MTPNIPASDSPATSNASPASPTAATPLTSPDETFSSVPLSSNSLTQHRQNHYQSSLSPERIRQLFRSLDPLDRGYIDHESILAASHSTRLPVSSAHPLSHENRAQADTKLRQLFAKELLDACTAGSGTETMARIDYAQFEAFLRMKEREIWTLFSHMDVGGDGELCFDDFGSALEKAGLRVSPGELQSFVHHIDADRDGVVSFDELLEFLLLLPRKSTVVNLFHYYQKTIHRTDLGETLLLPEKPNAGAEPSSSNTMRYFLAGGIAGSISRTITAPLDRIKVLLQVQIKPKGETVKRHPFYQFRLLGKKILADGGVWSFWRGNGLNILKIMPETGIRFYVFETTKRILHRREMAKKSGYQSTSGDSTTAGEKVLHHNVSTKTRFIAGGISGFCSQLAIYPLETVKIRMMTEQLSAAKTGNRPPMMAMSASRVARKMWKTEGMRSFFRGLAPSLLGIMPYASIDLTVYETLKNSYVRWRRKEPTPGVHMLCGAASGLLSATIVYPLGLVRTRLQAQGSSSHAVTYPRGAIDVITRTYAQESIAGFYKGLVPTLVKVVPAVSMSYFVYEQAKKVLGVY